MPRPENTRNIPEREIDIRDLNLKDINTATTEDNNLSLTYTQALFQIYEHFAHAAPKPLEYAMDQTLTPAELSFLVGIFGISSGSEHKIKGIQDRLPKFWDETESFPTVEGRKYQTPFNEDDMKYELSRIARQLNGENNITLLTAAAKAVVELSQVNPARAQEIFTLLRENKEENEINNSQGILTFISGNDVVNYVVGPDISGQDKALVEVPLFKPEDVHDKDDYFVFLQELIGKDSMYAKDGVIQSGISSSHALYELVTGLGLARERKVSMNFRQAPDQEITAFVYGLEEPEHPVDEPTQRKFQLAYASTNTDACFEWTPKSGINLEKALKVSGAIKPDSEFWDKLWGESINGVHKDEDPGQYDALIREAKSIAYGIPEGLSMMIRVMLKTILAHDFNSDQELSISGAREMDYEVKQMEQLGISFDGKWFDGTNMKLEGNVGEYLSEYLKLLKDGGMLQFTLS